MTQAYTGADALLDALIACGADTAFGVPGESYLAALDAIHRRGKAFRFITCRHEAGAANMADAAGKLTGKPGICFVTRGPGATHATIGLHTAFQDSTPMILLIGQVAREQKDREAFQEIDYTHFLSEVTKWTAEVSDPARIGEYVHRAFTTATSGRPGPVALALPEDVLSGLAPRVPVRAHTPNISHPNPEMVGEVAERLLAAKRPFFLVGGSGWTREAVSKLAHITGSFQWPVAASFRAQDRLDSRHASYVGDMGIGANPKLVAHMQASDLIVALGPRLGEMTTAGYSRLTPPIASQPLVHIHQGAEELGRVYQADISVCSAPGPFLDALEFYLEDEEAGSPATAPNWRRTCRADYLAWSNPASLHGSMEGPVQLSEIYAHLNDTLGDDIVWANGAGTYSIWLHRFAKYGAFPSQLAPTSGAMGYGVPAGVAAKILNPQRTVVAAAGDGCFAMGMSGLLTAAQYKAGGLFLIPHSPVLSACPKRAPPPAILRAHSCKPQTLRRWQPPAVLLG